MRRREFITFFGGAAAAWPLKARAQQSERVRRIGVLWSLAAEDAELAARVAAFRQALRQFGWVDGQNVQIDSRSGAGDPERIRKEAADLVLGSDVILATGSVAVGSVQQMSRTVPVVFAAVPDPVGAGYVNSLARPGGNATGFTTLEYGQSGKWLELLKQLAPRVARAVVLRARHIHQRPQFGVVRTQRGHSLWAVFDPNRTSTQSLDYLARRGQ
jgi:putative ABC transport system substrate-binding protein